MSAGCGCRCLFAALQRAPDSRLSQSELVPRGLRLFLTLCAPPAGRSSEMRLTQVSLANPAAIAIVAALVGLLGLLSMLHIPAQLLPQIEKPVVTVFNAWPGAARRVVESRFEPRPVSGPQFAD